MVRNLNPAERQALKARAHKLEPVVMIGAEGLTEAVIQEIDRNLTAHELIKIRVLDANRDERDDLFGLVCASSGASPVQHIGKIFVIFRERQPGEGVSDEQPPAPRRERPHHVRPEQRRRQGGGQRQGQGQGAPQGNRPPRPGRAPKKPPRSGAAPNPGGGQGGGQPAGQSPAGEGRRGRRSRRSRSRGPGPAQG
jgi:putative YhbY family RNA-binding protein